MQLSSMFPPMAASRDRLGQPEELPAAVVEPILPRGQPEKLPAAVVGGGADSAPEPGLFAERKSKSSAFVMSC
jgi:hypothetical protein